MGEAQTLVEIVAVELAVATYYDIEPDMYDSREAFVQRVIADKYVAGGTDFRFPARAAIDAVVGYYIQKAATGAE